MENKIKKKKKKKNFKIYQSLKPPRSHGIAKAAHIALEVCIFRLSNVGPHFINCVVDPQNSGPNWSICRNIKKSVVTELSVFVVASVVASCFLSRRVLWACSWIVLRHTLIISQHKFYSAVLFLSRQECLMLQHQTCFSTSFSYRCSFGVCRNIIFLVATNIYFSTYQLRRDRISLSP